MSTPHLRPLAVVFGKARRLAGTNPNNNESSTESTGRQL